MHNEQNRNLTLSSLLAVVLAGCSASGSTSVEPIGLTGQRALDELSPESLNSDGTASLSAMFATFPATANSDFTVRFPDSVIDGRSRILSYDAGVLVNEIYTIKGDFGTAEVEATYSAEGTYLSSSTESEVKDLPASLLETIQSSYPDSALNEIERTTDQSGVVTYQIEIETELTEAEVVLDSAGVVISTISEISQSQVPTPVLNFVSSELANYDDFEYEELTEQNGATTYIAELENDVESVSFTLTDIGDVLTIVYAQDL